MYRPQCDESRIETSETLYLGFAELSESTGEGHSPAAFQKTNQGCVFCYVMDF
jgi:hypothetical protein